MAIGTTTDDNYDCPQCGRYKAVSLNMHSGIYSCLYCDCLWSNRKRCEYPNCYCWVKMPDDSYCKTHQDLANFIKKIASTPSEGE